MPGHLTKYDREYVYGPCPAVDSGATQAQIFVGRKTHVTDAYPMKTPSDFTATLQDNVRERGAPNRLLSDQAQTEINGRAKTFL